MAGLKVTDLGDYLREQRQSAKLSLRQLAEVAGVSNPYLSQVERGLRKPSAEVLQQIAHGLRISAEALYVRAGILEERGEHADGHVEASVLADPHLTDRQRRVLLDIYATFRSENDRTPAEAAAPRKAARKSATRKSTTRKTTSTTTPAAQKARRDVPGGN